MLYNEYQKQIEQYIRMLATNNDNFLVVISPPGYGKTTMVLKAMEHYPNAFKYVNGYITPMEFYLTLWQTTKLASPKFLILDDVEYSLGERKIQILLKGATSNQPNGHRIIHYISSNSKVALTPKLEFDGKIIMLLNELPKQNNQIKAILDRAIFVNIFMTDEEILASMEQSLLPNPYGDLTEQERKEVYHFLKKHSDSIDNLSFRHLIHGYKCFEYSKQTNEDWRPLYQSFLTNQID